ncbi:uncharacterized protein BYT42DRAFT_559714 [Radiomyces spectabilis]|uniref:uncharacterized protein n=1 Tax=Radiomyces spectabilis TaxID=64574 RepID=UPI00221E764E|nr:uncharacterized protein BYT42DRAFT_559714 [Radiomyces spectabilis]KAI8388327.1 hypothetical protein BYT42DRAFT_559714 [Radiomyces spectabilis]
MPSGTTCTAMPSDEESALCADSTDYGAFRHSNTLVHRDHSVSSDDTSSRASSDADEIISKISKRRKQRMQRRHCSRPILPSFSDILPNKKNLSESEDEPPTDLVLPALNPTAQEVIASIPSSSSLDQLLMRRTHVNLSTVRAKYRNSRKNARDEKYEVYSIIRSFQYYLNYNAYVSAIKCVLFANRTIVLFVKLDLLVDLLFCLAYLFEMKQEFAVDLEPFWLYKHRTYDLWFICQLLSIWDFGSFTIRFFMTQYPMSVLLSFRCFIELLTTIPFLVSNFIEHGQYLYVPYFLRSWILLLRIKSVMKIKINLQMTDKALDPLKYKFAHLIGTIVALMYNGSAAFQYCEATFGSDSYTILDSLYVVMVTLSTVGYGDITPTTEASRIVMMLLIVISLAVLPTLIAGVSETLSQENDGGGHIGKGSMPFILIVGTFTPDQVNEIVDGFVNTENAESHLNMVFLDINKPSEELKLMERNSMWGHRIRFLHGSVLSEKTLQRVQARYAKAIFTISDQNATEPNKEDERNTVRLWSLYCYTVSHNVPIYTYNLSPSTAIYQKVAQEIICLREFKQYLLAMNCRCRGVSTVLTNLLHQRQPLNQYDESWQAQYDDGSCNEIYMAPATQCIIGLRFAYAAWIIYKECQAILFAIKTFVPERNDYEILLNPCHDYTIKSADLCVFIAESPKEIRDIEHMNSIYVWQTIRTMENQRRVQQQTTDMHVPCPAASESVGMEAMSSSDNNTRGEPSLKSTIHQKLHEQIYRISKLPSPRHALLTGSRTLIKRLGKDPLPDANQDTAVPLCYLLDKPAVLDDIVIQSTEGVENHILVCLHREVINIFKFIYNLRSPHMKPHELQDIVLLCSKLPKPKIFEMINMFPRVYFMEGNCRYPDDLLRAGIRRAKQVVVMSEKEYLYQYERNSDSPAIMASHIMDLLLQERPNHSYTIVNLVDKYNIKFMHLLQGKDVAEEIDVFYTPAYAAGDVVADSLLSNVLLSQTYYKPDIVSIIKTLCGMPGPLCDGSAAYLLATSDRVTTMTTATIQAPHLTSIPIPPEFVNQTFAFMFESLLLDQGILPIGLLRAPSEAFGNELPFVYTNPVPSLLLKEDDVVYILSRPGYA